MPGCALLILLALAMLVAAPGMAGDLPLGFVIGLVAGLLLSLLGAYNAGWNAHVDHVEARDHTKAHETAQRDRR